MDEDNGWHQTACILCSINCGIEVQLDGPTISRVRGDKAHPSSEGYTCEKALRLDHYQNGPHRLTTPLRRRPDGTFEAIDWDTAIAEVAARFADVRRRPRRRRRSSTTAVAARGTTSAAATARRRERARHPLQLERAGPGEDGRVLGRRPAVRTIPLPHDRRLRARRGRGVLGQEPVAVARVPAGTAPSQGDRQRSRAHADRHRSPAHRDGRPRRHPPPGPVPGGDAYLLAALLAVLVEDGHLDRRLARRARQRPRRRRRRTCAASTSRRRVPRPACPRTRSAERPVSSARRPAGVDLRGPRHPAGAALDAEQLPREARRAADRQLRRAGRDEPAHPLRVAGPGGGRSGEGEPMTPTGSHRLVTGLVPCNVIPDEILTDHPDRFRALLVETATRSTRWPTACGCARRCDALELVVVIDVAITETAREADYVLPASSQLEKWEARSSTSSSRGTSSTCAARSSNRCPARCPSPRSTPACAVRSAPTRTRTSRRSPTPRCRGGGRTSTPSSASAHANPTSASCSRCCSTRRSVRRSRRLTACPLRARPRCGASPTAAPWPTPTRSAVPASKATAPSSARRCSTRCWRTRRASRSPSTTTTRRCAAWRQPTGVCQLAIPMLLDELGGLADEPAPRSADGDFPFVLSAGERRSSTANTIYRDPAWRKKDPHGSLRIAPDDAESLGLADGDRAWVRTRRGAAVAVVEVTDTMSPGHVSLPNGFGLGTRVERRRWCRAERADVVRRSRPTSPARRTTSTSGRRSNGSTRRSVSDAPDAFRRLAVPDRPHDRPHRRLVDAARDCARRSRVGAASRSFRIARRSPRRAHRPPEAARAPTGCSWPCPIRTIRCATSTG